MSDIVDRLREAGRGLYDTQPLARYCLEDDAATEIERLRAELAAREYPPVYPCPKCGTQRSGPFPMCAQDGCPSVFDESSN